MRRWSVTILAHHFMKKAFLTVSAALGLLLMTGCIPLRTNGTTHYVVIGFGVVSVNNTNQAVAQVTKTTVLGGYASEHGGGIGFSTQNRIMVSTNSDLTIEVNSVPFKSMKVNVQ